MLCYFYDAKYNAEEKIRNSTEKWAKVEETQKNSNGF